MGLARSTYYDEPEIQPIDEARLVEQIKEVCAELSFPKIISVHSDDAIRIRLVL
jgi:hypothetical protein